MQHDPATEHVCALSVSQNNGHDNDDAHPADLVAQKNVKERRVFLGLYQRLRKDGHALVVVACSGTELPLRFPRSGLFLCKTGNVANDASRTVVTI
jgi:hypothetical protein